MYAKEKGNILRILAIAPLRFAAGASAVGILTLAAPEHAHAFESVKFAITEICDHMQGNLGGLLMTVAAVGGLASAAFGNVKAMQSMVVTGIGAATVSTFLGLYFSDAGQLCDGQGSEIGTNLNTARTDAGFAVGGADSPDRGKKVAPGIPEAALNTALGREVQFQNSPSQAQDNLAENDEEFGNEQSSFDGDFGSVAGEL